MNKYEIQTMQIVDCLQRDARLRTFKAFSATDVRRDNSFCSVYGKRVAVGHGSVTIIRIDPSHEEPAYLQRVWLKIPGVNGAEGYLNEFGFIVFENLPLEFDHFLVQYHGDRAYPVAPPQEA